jgi:hypothetical protein
MTHEAMEIAEQRYGHDAFFSDAKEPFVATT